MNLTKQLLVDLFFLREYLGAPEFERRVVLATGSCLDIVEDPDSIIAIMAKDHLVIRELPLDYVINIASMQEMDPPVIAEYFGDLRRVAARRPLHFYCCNREEKVLPDGTVTRFLDYPWVPEDRILHEGLPPWHQRYYSFYPPFYRPYDGRHMHRWVRLAGGLQGLIDPPGIPTERTGPHDGASVSEHAREGNS
ncbi:MAG: hypothetical protein O2958_06230 [Gemmatimonadetes bacterium]|nr:hypothetical protein [Gemmatimonadota bacterium]